MGNSVQEQEEKGIAIHVGIPFSALLTLVTFI